MDIFEKCYAPSLAGELKEKGVYPYFHALQSRQDVEVMMEGKRRIMLGSNNYLGLTTDPVVVEAGIKALERYGTGCSGSRFLNGTLEMHLELEDALAKFLRKPGIVTFGTGFQSNVGIISALVGRHDYVICDRENHASIYAGCQLSYGKMLRYRHSDMADLEKQLQRVPEQNGALIVTAGVFSMGGDIAKLPHMLIAGTTGSGKSVCMNTLIVSLLYKAKPDEVRLIMVDPKMVELGVYNGIPQLLIPVVTDPKKAAGALQWTVTEMMRRYRLMSEEGVRDLDSYNKAIAGDPERQKLPQIVVVIDELADLMLVAAKEVEESICRIAQMGRASGIHLVIATQRPSADVITGLMKANIPSRIAFAVSSAMESRIILDTPGAEKLVGKGDMLFAPLGQGKPKRVQGCFISDEEVQAVVNAVKAQSQSDYSAEVMEQIERRAEQSGKPDSGAAAQDTGEGDELLPAAVDVILETGQASVSFLQRRLKLGYARAARIVDEMEERGIIGPYEGAKPRQLLITREQWEQMQNGTYAPPAPPVEDELP